MCCDGLGMKSAVHAFVAEMTNGNGDNVGEVVVEDQDRNKKETSDLLKISP